MTRSCGQQSSRPSSPTPRPGRRGRSEHWALVAFESSLARANDDYVNRQRTPPAIPRGCQLMHALYAHSCCPNTDTIAPSTFPPCLSHASCALDSSQNFPVGVSAWVCGADLSPCLVRGIPWVHHPGPPGVPWILVCCHNGKGMTRGGHQD